jgi:hypothetical protein
MKIEFYNKATNLVNQMVLNKLEEVHCVVANLRVLTQSHDEITTSQIVAIEKYITWCTRFNFIFKVLISMCNVTFCYKLIATMKEFN